MVSIENKHYKQFFIIRIFCIIPSSNVRHAPAFNTKSFYVWLFQVERLDQKLAEHEERAEELDRKRTSTISTISLINDRNRKNNIIRAEKSIKNEVA